MKNASQTLKECFSEVGEHLKAYCEWVILNQMFLDLFREEPNYEDKYLPRILGDLHMRL